MNKGLKIGLIAGGIVVALCGFGTLIGGTIAASNADPSPPARIATTAESTAPVSRTESPVSESTAPKSPTVVTIQDGTWTIGTDKPAGVYRSSGPEEFCYWAILKTGSNGNDIIANDLPRGGHPQVTLKKGQDFETDNCGTWTKVK